MKNMEGKILQWLMPIMMTVMSTIVSYAVNLLADMSKNLQSLNEKMAVIIEKTTYQEAKIEKLDARLQLLEHKK
jgi:hypothetical protein